MRYKKLHISLCCILVLVFSLNKAYTQNINQGLIAHYPLDGDGTDIGPLGLHAEIHGPSAALDIDGNTFGALLFDGIDDYLEFPNRPKLKPKFPLTISMSVKLPLYDFPKDMGFVNNDNFAQNYHGVFISTNKDGYFALNYGFGDGCTCPTNTVSRLSNVPLSTVTWYQITGIIHESGEISLYLNCEEVSGDYSGLSVDSTREIKYSDKPGRIGTLPQQDDQTINHMHGIMDDLMIWDRALTEEEVKSLYLETLECDDNICSNGVEYWDGCECKTGEPNSIVNCDDNLCSNGIESWNDALCKCDTILQINGCTDPTASNFNPLANCDDGECNFQGNSVYIPNVFNPDADAPNNTLLIQGNNIQDITTIIYDRWGNQVFKSEVLDHGWDGRLNNKNTSSSFFIYQIKVTYTDQTSEEKYGSFNLLK